MNVRFEVQGPLDFDEGKGWNVSMSIGSPKNIFTRNDRYEKLESAVRAIKKAAICFKQTVKTTAVVYDSRDPLNPTVYENVELRKKP